MFCVQSKSAASSMREWTEQETLLLLEVHSVSVLNMIRECKSSHCNTTLGNVIMERWS